MTPRITRPRLLTLRVAKRLPEPLLASPERIFVNVAAILIGCAGLWPPPGSPVDAWPQVVQYEWAVSMMVGGYAALHGAWTGYRRSERLGAALFAFCAFQFAIQVVHLAGLRGLVTTTLFVLLAAAKVVRIIRSVAVETVEMQRAAGQEPGL